MRNVTIFLAAAVAVAAAASPAAADPWDDLAALADDCTAAHDYDPREPGPVGERELATGEQVWRDCMHAGIEQKIMPRSPVADEWRALVYADRLMTARIAIGDLTRAERAAALQYRVAQIQLAEIAATDRQVKAVEQQREIQDSIEQIRRTVPRFF